MDNENDIFSVIGRLPGYSKLLIRLYAGKNIKGKHKLVLSIGIAYSLSPVDFIPGIIPIAGQLDNLLVMLRCIKKVLDAVDAGVRDEYLQEAGITMEQLEDDIKLTLDTLKSIGNGVVKVMKNVVKITGYSAIYGFKKLVKKKPY